MGWHVPSDDEWISLSDYLGSEIVAGGKQKKIGFTHRDEPNFNVTDESRFSDVAAGTRLSKDYGRYIGLAGYLWSSSEATIEASMMRLLSNDTSALYSYSWSKNHGHSIRCLYNNFVGNRKISMNKVINIFPNPLSERIYVEITLHD